MKEERGQGFYEVRSLGLRLRIRSSRTGAELEGKRQVIQRWMQRGAHRKHALVGPVSLHRDWIDGVLLVQADGIHAPLLEHEEALQAMLERPPTEAVLLEEFCESES